MNNVKFYYNFSPKIIQKLFLPVVHGIRKFIALMIENFRKFVEVYKLRLDGKLSSFERTSELGVTFVVLL